MLNEVYKKHLIKTRVQVMINKVISISFKENTLSREMSSADAILMLRDANASVKFQQSQDYAKKADSVDSNPIVALGYKLYRAFNLLSEKDKENTDENIDYVA